MRLVGGTVVTMGAGREVIPDGAVLTEGSRLTYVGPRAGAPSPAEGEEVLALGAGDVVIPGLIQSHIHLCQTLFRNQADDLALLDWLRQRIWPFEAAHDEASLRASADLGIAELLRGGTTALLDMGTVNHTAQVFEAARDAGIRASIGKCHMDVDAGQPAPLLEDTRRSLAESIALCDAWHGAEGGRIRYAFAPRFVLSCTEPLLREIAAAARSRGVRLHTHASENRDECALVRQTRGRDNVAYFDEIGFLGPDCVLAHCIHLADEEVAALAGRSVKVAHCPSSNLKLGSGIAPVPELLARGVSVSLGADGAPCNNNLDAFVEMRLAALIQKPRLGPRALPAPTVFAMATIEGARALGLEGEIGSLEVGKKADIAVVGLDRIETGPSGDIYARLVYAAKALHVRHVVVDGRLLVREGELLTLDADRVLARAAEEWARLAPRADALRR